MCFNAEQILRQLCAPKGILRRNLLAKVVQELVLEYKERTSCLWRVRGFLLSNCWPCIVPSYLTLTVCQLHGIWNFQVLASKRWVSSTCTVSCENFAKELFQNAIFPTPWAFLTLRPNSLSPQSSQVRLFQTISALKFQFSSSNRGSLPNSTVQTKNLDQKKAWNSGQKWGWKVLFANMSCKFMCESDDDEKV